MCRASRQYSTKQNISRIYWNNRNENELTKHGAYMYTIGDRLLLLVGVLALNLLVLFFFSC